MKIQASWHPGMPRTSNLWQALSISEFMGHSQSVFWWPNSKSHDPGSGVGTWLLLANTLCQLWIYYLGWKDKRGNWFFVWTQGDQEWSCTWGFSRKERSEHWILPIGLQFSSGPRVLVITHFHAAHCFFWSSSVPRDASFSFPGKQKKSVKTMC